MGKMRRDPDFFGDQDMVLIYIAKRLRDALKLESLLTEAGLDYLVELDNYVGGVLFRRERAGAFFYVLPGMEEATRHIMAKNGFRPQAE